MAASVREFLGTWKSLKNDDFLSKRGLIEQLIRDKQILATKEGQAAIVSYVNQSISSGQTRVNGLVLLIHYMDQIPQDVFKTHVLSWLEQLSLFLEQYLPDYIHRLTCRTLSVLIYRISRCPEQSHQASTNIIPNIYHLLIKANQAWRLEAARCLFSCLNIFAGPAGPFKEKLTKFLVPMLLSGHEDVVEVALKCYCELPSCGGGGHQGSKYTEAWGLDFQHLLASINILLTQAYSEVEDEDDHDEKTDTDGFPWLCEVGEDLHLLVERLSLACRCASRMLSMKVSYQRTIKVSAIIRTVARALNVNALMLEARPSTSRLRLAALISPIHQAALCLLDGLIICCQSNLLPHSTTVSKMYLQTLSWTSQKNPDRRLYRSLRMRVYKSMITWFDGVRLGLDVDDLLTEMSADLKPETNSIKLEGSLQSVSTLMSTKKKGRNRKKVVGSGGEEIKIQENSSNEDVVCECLAALKLLLEISTYRLKASSLNSLQELTVRTILNCQSGQAAPPYNAARGRRGLYEVMRTLLTVRHGKWMPALHVYMRTFTAGMREENEEIRRLCSEALIICTANIHPRVPALYSPYMPDGNKTKQTNSSASPLTTSAPSSGPGIVDINRRADPEPSISEFTVKKCRKSQDLHESESSVKSGLDVDSSTMKLTDSLEESSAVENVASEESNEENSDDETQETMDLVSTTIGSPRGVKRQSDEQPGTSAKLRAIETDNDDEEDTEVNDMLSAFVDVGPDSDE